MNSRRTPYAINSLRKHVIYLEEHAGLEIAERYLDAVEETLTFLCKSPEIGSPCEFTHPRIKSMRRWPVRDFENYLLFYQATEKELLLLYVFHGKQDINSILDDPPGEDY